MIDKTTLSGYGFVMAIIGFLLAILVIYLEEKRFREAGK